MHCDRCDTSEAVKWTRGREAGDPVLPDRGGEVRAPRTGTSTLEKYILCPDCLLELHEWVLGNPRMMEIEAELEKKGITL